MPSVTSAKRWFRASRTVSSIRRNDLRTHGVVTIEVALLESARVNCLSARSRSATSLRQELLDLLKFELALFRSSGVGHFEFSQRIKDNLGDD